MRDQFVATSFAALCLENPTLNLEWQGTERKNVDAHISPTITAFTTSREGAMGDFVRRRMPAVKSSTNITGITTKDIRREWKLENALNRSFCIHEKLG